MNIEKRNEVAKEVEKILERMKSLGHLREEDFVRSEVRRILESYDGLNGHRPSIVAMGIVYMAHRELRERGLVGKVRCLRWRLGGYHDIGSLPYFNEYFGPSEVSIRNARKTLKDPMYGKWRVPHKTRAYDV